MNTLTSFFFSFILFLTTFFFLFSTRFGNNFSIRHIQRIFLQRTRTFSHGTTTKRCNQLSQRIWLPFFLLIFLLLLFRIFKRLLQSKPKKINLEGSQAILKYSQSNLQSQLLGQYFLLEATSHRTFWQKCYKHDV